MYEFVLRFAAFKFQEICLTQQLARWPITTHWFTFELARSILIKNKSLNCGTLAGLMYEFVLRFAAFKFQEI